MSPSALDRARNIRLILFDVDGVLTDGSIWFLPGAGAGGPIAAHIERMEGKGGYAIPSGSMIEAKGFSAHDGSGISLARLGGLQCGIVTKRISEAVALRARDLRLEYVYMGQAHKLEAVREIMRKGNYSLEQIAYVGDDVIDLPVMRVCGLAVAVPNARPQVKEAAHLITANSGGQGAGRDAIEFVLEAQGSLHGCIEKYISERG